MSGWDIGDRALIGAFAGAGGVYGIGFGERYGFHPGLTGTIGMLSRLGAALTLISARYGTGIFGQCFPAGTPILLADGRDKLIEDIRPGDTVLAFDQHGDLHPRKVARLLPNVTSEWLEFEFAGGGRLTLTPGHLVLNESRMFERADALAARGAAESPTP